jgi:hypothetical protein
LQKIIIFGDSYAVSGQNKFFNYQKTWSDMLSDDYDIENFAITGCGPDLQLQKLIKYFDYNKTNDDIIIFVMPHHLRLALKDIEDVEHVYSFVYLHNKVKSISQKIKDRLNLLKLDTRSQSYKNYVTKYSLFLDLWYEYFLKSNTYLETEPLKIASLVSKYRKNCKKVILLPIHPIDLKNKHLIEEENFIVADISLRLLDENENIDTDIFIKNNGFDPRAGHLSIHSHFKVYKHLKEVIDGKVYS